MLQIQLPDNLLAEIEAAGVTGSAVDAFVQQAVREKLAAAKMDGRKSLTKQTSSRRSMNSMRSVTQWISVLRALICLAINCMNAVDTNVLIYRLDRSEPSKRAVASMLSQWDSEKCTTYCL